MKTKCHKHQHARDAVGDNQRNDQIEDQVLREVKSEVDELVDEQHNDQTLKNIWEETDTGDSCYMYADGLLYQLSSDLLAWQQPAAVNPTKQGWNVAIC